MSVSIVSDIHIQGPEDPCFRALIALVTRCEAGDTLVLAGDIFDFLIGDQKVLYERYRGFLDAVRSAGERGAEIHYIEGNHDFHLRRLFARETPRMKLHPAEVMVEFDRKKIYVAHGDLVDGADMGYLALRALFRSPLTKFLSYRLPGRLVAAIGERSSRLSQKKNPRTPVERGTPYRDRMREVYRAWAERKLAEGYDYVVLGHCHDDDEKQVSLPGRMAQYVNVGFPRVHGTYLVLEEGKARFRRAKFEA